ncbi:MAG: hypothetical protein SF051_07090 [Elusimicrobiota bacterium]|nr:hypothetical protein [Elusimicrobiota bacterium]
MKLMFALAALAAIPSFVVPAAAHTVPGVPDPVNLRVYHEGGQLTPAQVAALQPSQIAAEAQAVAQQAMVIMGATSVRESGEGIAASPSHAQVAIQYARVNRDAFYAARRHIIDLEPPQITPDNINDPGVMAEIRRSAQVNALNDRKRRAIDEAVTRIATVVGYCSLLNCGD